MRGIKGRLLSAFLSVVAILSVASLVFLAANLWITNQYKSASDAMIAEFRLVANAQILIDAFNTRVQSAGTDSTESRQRIDTAKAEIQTLFLVLDEAIIDTQSKSDYLGFKASVERFIAQIDEGLQRFEQENIKDYFSDYNSANKLYGFVRDNGTVLIFSQLQYQSSLRDAIDQAYRMSLLIGFGALIVIILGSTFFVLRFASYLVAPLVSLTKVSQQLAGGSMDVQIIDESISRANDEVGLLARSFTTMAIKLRDKLKELDTQNKEIAKSSEIVTGKNSELERLNKLMVDRELKMVKLKERIAELEGAKDAQSQLSP